MRRNNILMLLSATALLALGPWACGDDDGTGGSGGGEPTSSSTSTSTTTTAVTTTSTGMVDCEGAFQFDPTCGACLEGNCCAEVSLCAMDSECSDCVTGSGDPAACGANAAYTDLGTCASSNCQAECFPEPVAVCNPVTGEACNVATGAACDVSADGFVCYASGNVKNLCDSCGANENDFCQSGMTCFDSICMKYCCDDGDCGTGVCEKSYFGVPNAPVGVCITAGSDPAMPQAACDAPVVSPSNGSCVDLGGGGGGGGGQGGGGGAGGGMGGAGGVGGN